MTGSGKTEVYMRAMATALTQGKQVICNVYEGAKWQRVEHYHVACYDDAEQPYGPPQT